MNQREDTLGHYDLETRHRPWLFRDRVDAGAQLARELEVYRGKHALVLGIPRGGVPVAGEVARRLDADLDVVVARKVGAPGQEELALGAVTADGTRCMNSELLELIGIPDAQLERLVAEQSAEASRREHRFRRGLPALGTEGRIVILVDDGLATGATMRAAVRALRGGRAAKLVVAVPVGAAETCERVAAEVDELVCPHPLEAFYAVGIHYQKFGQTSDDEVERILSEHRAPRGLGQQAKQAH